MIPCCEREVFRMYPGLENIPVLKYLKEPVLRVTDLYINYPNGGEYGWFAWSGEDKGFRYWDIDSRKWELISAGDLQTLVGVSPELLKDGDIPVWDAESEKFVIINLSLWGTEEY